MLLCYKTKRESNFPWHMYPLLRKNNYFYISRNFSFIKVLFPTQSNRFHKFSQFSSSNFLEQQSWPTLYILEVYKKVRTKIAKWP